MSLLTLRDAVVADLADINDIYNHYVATSTCTYQCEPSSLAERRAWFEERGRPHPVTVAVRGDEIIGWGSLSPFRARCGYRFTAETTVYVRHDAHRQGVGRVLLADLIQRAASIGHRALIASISAEQSASVALHRAAGFTEAALLRQVGFKFDQWLDLILMQLLLEPQSPPEPGG